MSRRYAEHTLVDSATYSGTGANNGSGKRVGGRGVMCTLEAVVGSLTGTNPTLDIKPQVSSDNVNWSDLTLPPDITESVAIAQLTGTHTGTAEVDSISFFFTGKYLRAVSTLGGTSPVATGVRVRAMFTD